ncbi:hypothetical protein KA071_01935 [Candidatus Gracilibacteria bacterium]|nr:hypothetical protein [Candidatus Gracilibacteria bacterium]
MLSKRILSSITTVALCASFMIPTQVFAAASFTGGTNVSGGLNTAVAITDLQVTGASEDDTIPVFLYVPNGSLSMTTTTGLTFTGSSSGQRLYFSGTLSAVNTALATLQFTHGSAGTFTLEASIIGAGQIYDPSTQHMYEVVNNGGAITATAARSAATSRSINGVSGYLANITSSDENSFVAARITQDGWFGASDSGVEGDWVWLDGPESGTLFWRGTAGGTAFGYENWAGSEPNQSGDEDCSQFYANGSGWNDLPCGHTGISTYIVEYGAPGNLPNVSSDTLDITLAADSTPPTITNVTSDKADGHYKAGEIIDIDVTFSEAVTSTGNVTVTLETGATDRTCTFTVSSTTTGTCNYTVQAGDTSSDLTVASITGTIADGAANAMNNFTPSTNLAANKAIVIDTTPPIISLLRSDILYPPGASITWTTNESTTSRVLYNNVAPGSLTYDVTDMDLVTDHTGIISGLQQTTSYSFYVTSTDAAGNSTNSDTDTFTTKNGGSGGTGGSNLIVIKQKEEVREKEEEAIVTHEPIKEGIEILKEGIEILKEGIETTVLNGIEESVCVIHPYLKNSVKFGKQNNPEDVKLLEQFLNRYENANLVVDGFYSREDFNAVVKWQEKHGDNILKPWGLKKGTGYVFKTSLAKIKEIEEGACDKGEQK